jgi:hypothetical protein
MRLAEAVSKCVPLTAGFKIREGDPDTPGLKTGIHGEFRGVKCEPDPDIGQKRVF